MIRFEHVSLAFREKSVFDDLTFEVENGANVCISGSSGRGKTSLLKLIQGYLAPDSGRITIGGQELTHTSVHRLRQEMAWIPQNINLPVNSGAELMDLMQIPEKKAFVIELLDRLALESDMLVQDFSRISGGQKQRIVISIVLSLGKSIILMDEPTSSLDEKSISRLLQVISSLEDTTIVSASHNQMWLDHSSKIVSL